MDMTLPSSWAGRDEDVFFSVRKRFVCGLWFVVVVGLGLGLGVVAGDANGLGFNLFSSEEIRWVGGELTT